MDIDYSPGLKVEDKLGLIQRVLQSGDYDVAVKECCTVFEIVFRKIFQQAIITLPYKERELLQEVERKIGKGTKGVEDLGFGELVGLFRESKLMEKWSKHTSRDMGLIQTLNYAEIVNLSRSTHHALFYEWIRSRLKIDDMFSGIHEALEAVVSLTEVAEKKQRQEEDERKRREAERFNKKITGISAVFLPLSIVTGLYGMNISWLDPIKEPWMISLLALGTYLLTFILFKYWFNKE